MSWETNKITVVSALTTLGYKEVPRDIDIEDNPDSMDHLHFTLFPKKPETRNLTSNGLLTSDIVELKVAYKAKFMETKESVYDMFIIVVRTLNALPICMGIENIEDIEKKNERTNKKYIGTVRFYIGAQSC